MEAHGITTSGRNGRRGEARNKSRRGGSGAVRSNAALRKTWRGESPNAGESRRSDGSDVRRRANAVHQNAVHRHESRRALR